MQKVFSLVKFFEELYLIIYAFDLDVLVFTSIRCIIHVGIATIFPINHITRQEILKS